jgi:hypothetical protein
MIGLCHTCRSSNMETKFDSKRLPVCTSCYEENEAVKRKEANK